MLPRLLYRRVLSASAAALMICVIAACGDGKPSAQPTSAPPALADDGPDARAELAARAAQAQDRSYSALYSLNDGNGAARNVLATVGADHTWRVDISGGALGGTADVTMVSVPAGTYQCTMSSPQRPITPTCIRVGNASGRVPADYDPKVQRLFRRWLNVFTDRQAPLSIAEVKPLAGASGTCFSIDSISASLKAPVDIGIYCYTDDGLLSAARVSYGVLRLVTQSAGPATVGLPGPEVQGQPMGMASPPAPPVQPSAAGSPAP